MLVSLAAAKKHCSFFAGAEPIRTHAKELVNYDTSIGTIRFQPDHPLPATLIRKLIKTRLAQRR